MSNAEVIWVGGRVGVVCLRTRGPRMLEAEQVRAFVKRSAYFESDDKQSFISDSRNLAEIVHRSFL